MVILDTTTALLQVITSAAGAIDTHVSMIKHDETGELFLADSENHLITTATTQTIAASPPSSTTKHNLKYVNIRNSHATVANTVEVKHTDGTTAVSLVKVTLAAGEWLAMNDAGAWFVYDINGGVKAGATTQLPLNNASTAAQTPAAATLTLLAGSTIAVPIGKLRIGTWFRWKFDITKTAAGTATSTYHVRVGTTGTTADAAILTFTKPLGTAVIDFGLIDITAIIRGPLSSSCIMAGVFNLQHNLPTTGHAVAYTTAAPGMVQVTSSAFDATVAGLIVSLTCTTGAADAITTQVLIAEAFNL